MPLARTALLVLVLVSGACAPAAQQPAGQRAGLAATISSQVVESAPTAIAGIARSMEGGFERLALDTSNIAYLTGFRTAVVDAASGAPMGDEFFCHSQLQLDTGARLMVAATGIPELRLPAGFGIPLQQILGDLEPEWRGVSLLGMVLNNHAEDLKAEVKLRFHLDYVAADDPGVAAIKNLYRASITVLPDRDVEVLYSPTLDDEPVAAALPADAHGKNGHWMVPPGRQIIRQRYSRIVPGTTQVHYGVAHLHNYARYLRLTDVTTGEVLWETQVEHATDRAQIVRIPAYTDAQGFRLAADHTYEIETEYFNPTATSVDAMAVMYLYHHPPGGRTMTYPPAPDASPPGVAGAATATHHH